MNATKPIQIFKPGTHAAMRGDVLSFSESDMAATADAVTALTALLAEHLGEVVAEYPDWRTRREFESAAAVYLIGKPDTEAVRYSDMATTADRIGQAPPALQEQVLTDLRAHTSAIASSVERVAARSSSRV